MTKSLKSSAGSTWSRFCAGLPMDRIDGVVRALIAGGVRVLEFTFDHDRENYLRENADKIRYVTEHYGDTVAVGCGTALSVHEVSAAHEAGAGLVTSRM